MSDSQPLRRRGRPSFDPTDEQRRQVEAMVGYGMPEAQIARLIHNPQTKRTIDEKTLRLHFRSEIDTGQVKANAAVAQSLHRMAINGVVAAAIFWAKTRMGWKETAALEMSGKDGVALVPAVHIIIGSAEDRSAPGTRTARRSRGNP
jgi:hypothetical protein